MSPGKDFIMRGHTTDVESVDERLQAMEQAVARSAEAAADPKEPVNFAGDKVGAGRYILGFLLAGPLGLLANYWARYYGWRGTWISLGIMIAGIAFLAATGAFDTVGQTCYQYPDGSIRCQ